MLFQTEEAGAKPAFAGCFFADRGGPVPRDAAVEPMLHAFVNDVGIIAEAAVVNALPLHVYDLLNWHRVMVQMRHDPQRSADHKHHDQHT
ncbi:MAG: hypothetical protein ACJ8E2_01805, partial [Bradyrhizobium sp.]